MFSSTTLRAPALLTFVLLSTLRTTSAYMDCGTVKLCAVLTLETGLGTGNYEHPYAVLHGLWPQNDSWGTSACVAPSSSKADIRYPAEYSEIMCYDQNKDNVGDKSEVGFANYEWEKHGWCAGLKDAQDFVNQACGMAAEPLKVMDEARKNGGSNVDDVADALKRAGYPVHYVNRDPDTQEVQISCCADPSGKWKIAAVKDFEKACGQSSSTPSSPSPSSPPPTTTSGGAGQCIYMQKGPACNGDADCAGLSGCVRCASSGFCTDIPLSTSDVCAPMEKGPSCSKDSDCTGLSGCVRCANSGFCTEVPLDNPSAPGGPPTYDSAASAFTWTFALLTGIIVAFVPGGV